MNIWFTIITRAWIDLMNKLLFYLDNDEKWKWRIIWFYFVADNCLVSIKLTEQIMLRCKGDFNSESVTHFQNLFFKFWFKEVEIENDKKCNDFLRQTKLKHTWNFYLIINSVLSSFFILLSVFLDFHVVFISISFFLDSSNI